ncbi:MAG: 4-alpha-glucanotransferase, partial [Pollutimonas bauzanensis]
QYIGRASPAGPGRVSIPAIGQAGYHSLAIGELQIPLAVAPARCPSVGDLTGRRPVRPWGVAAQVYSLRRAPAGTGSSAPVWPGWESGGDFAALAVLARHAGQSGASALAISPVHAMFSADPQRYSPYAPSSRLFLNAAYIEPSIVMGAQAVSQAVGQMDPAWSCAAAQDTGRVDWHHVLPRRLKLLRRLFDNFLQHGPADLRQKFAAFRQRGGEALESHACYEALHAHHLAALGPASGWQDWPSELHDPRGPSVGAYAAAHAAEIGFHVFLQWLADSGMQLAQRHARDAGMPIGLIADLAIGTDPRGSHAWSKQGEMLAGVSVGAPPDLFQPRGQSWGLTAFSPRALRQTAYAAFIETLRAAL